MTPPGDLEKAFKGNNKAKKFFDSPAFSHKREYVDWIISAKRGETRSKRVLSKIEKLNASQKTFC